MLKALLMISNYIFANSKRIASGFSKIKIEG